MMGCANLVASACSKVMSKKVNQVRLSGRVSPEVAEKVINKLRALGFPYGDVANVGAFWDAVASGRVSVTLTISPDELKKLSEKG
jgi:hypothetical protein